MSTLHSSHIFLFPFKWEHHPIESKSHSFSKKEKFDAIDAALKGTKWKSHAFNFGNNPYNTFNTYNEFAYFHDYARDILSLDGDASTTKKQLYYDLKDLSDPTYKISILNKPKNFEFNLYIEDITLNFYENGVGVLAFHLNNFQTGHFDSILKINEYGRRIYPQFLGTDCNVVIGTKSNFLPDYIELLNFSTPIREDFTYYNQLEAIREQPFRLPNHIQKLLGDGFKAKAYDKKTVQQGITIQPILDDRMFTMSFMVNTDFIKAMGKLNTTTGNYAWMTDKNWYRYVFVDDSEASCHSIHMIEQQLRASTNDRWLTNEDASGKNIGHIFGITRYSFNVITADCYFGNNFLIHHFKSPYFQMVQLVLVQRAFILNFSAQASTIIKNENPNIGQISRLHLDYIGFINKIYFREITPQEQGIELYKLLQAQMEIEQNVKDLDNEIRELHDYSELEFEKKRNNTLDRITKYGAAFAAAGLVLSFFGTNYFGNDALALNPAYGFANANSLSSIIFILVLSFLGGLLAYQYFKNKKK